MKVTGKHEFDSIPLVNSTDKLIGIIETASAPTSASDSTAGYYRGYRWVDTSTNLTYVCVDDTAGAAIWTDYGSQISTINNTLASITPQNELISGGVVYSGTGFVYNTTSLVYRIGGVQYTAAAAAPAFTLSAADPTNDRIDLVYVNTAGTVAVKTGTPAAAPARPTLDDPATELIVTFITVAAATTTPSTGFENIYLEDAEWTVGGTGTITSNATANPDTGTYHVDASLLGNNSGTSQTLTFTRGSDYTLPTDLTAASLNFKIKLDTVLPYPYEWRIVWKDASSNNVSQYITFQNIFWGGGSIFGIDLTDTLGYQQASIPLNVFNFTSTTVRSLQIEFRRYGPYFWGSPSFTYSFDIDEVKIEEGGTAPLINTYVTTDGNATGDGTIGQVAIWDGSNNIIGDNSIRYVISPGTKVGIDLTDSTDESRSTFEAGSAQVISDGYAATMRINSYSDAGVTPELHGAILQLRRGRGTEGTPIGVNNGDQIGVVDVYGFHDGGGVAVGEAVVGQIAFVANDTFADSNNIGSLFQISTTLANGTGGAFGARYRITKDGYHRFYNNVSIATALDPAARLHIAASTTTLPHIAFNNGSNVTSPSNGDLWYNGTNLNFRSGGVTTDLLAGGGIFAVVDDTTPQLGGTLDANGNIIDMGVNTITDTKVGQWDAAYSWGDHSLAGYALVGSYAAGVIPKWDSTTNTLVNGMIQDDGNRVSIVKNIGVHTGGSQQTFQVSGFVSDNDLATRLYSPIKSQLSLTAQPTVTGTFSSIHAVTGSFLSTTSDSLNGYSLDFATQYNHSLANGFHIRMLRVSTGDTVNTVSGIRIEPFSIQGTATNVYGIYQVGSELNRFGGNVRSEGQFYSPQHSTGVTANAATFNCNNGNSMVLDLTAATADVTLTFSNMQSGGTYFLKVIQKNANFVNIGTYTVSGGSVKFPSGTAPTITTSPFAIDTIVFYYDGINVFGNYSQDYQ